MYSMGQEPENSSCGTTQVDAEMRPLAFAHPTMHAPLITGGVPVADTRDMIPFALP